jgi:Na+/melibiose symporter-like transporter
MDSSSQTELQNHHQDQESNPTKCQKQTKQQKMIALTKSAATFVYNNPIINIIVCFILCNIMHHYASKLYIYFCAYSTPLFQLNSVLMSPIVIISPHCMALRWLILETSNTVYFHILSCCSIIIAKLSK